MKRFICIALALVMVLSMAPMAFAADGDASVTEVGTYNDLVTAVAEGGEIKLTADIAIDQHIDISGTVTLDLNGKTISASETWTTSSENDTPIVVKRGGNLTIKDSAGNGKIDASAKGAYSAVKMTEKGEDATGTPATLTVESGTLIGKWYGISGNGSRHDTSITIRGGTIKHTETTAGCGIYHPQNGTLTIFGGEITGVTGIEMRAGTLTMKDGTVRGTASPTKVNPNGSGTTSNGAGIAVAQHTTALDLKVSIYGGTVEGYSALYESNPQKNSEDAINKVFVDIGGGTFTSINGGTVAVYSENDRVWITGGTFSSDPTSYVLNGWIATKSGDVWVVESDHKAMILRGDAEHYFLTLAAAVDGAVDGETIILQKDTTIDSTIKIEKEITIDGNGKTLTYTGVDRAITVDNTANGADLTVKNLTVDCTASYCQRGINYNTTGTLTLDNVTVKGTHVSYAVNLPSSSDGATVNITGCDITGLIALNIWGENAKITVTDTALTSVDETEVENYCAVALNNDGSNVADGTIVIVTGGSITALDENDEPSSAVRNGTLTGKVNISDTTTVTGAVNEPVAVVVYEGYTDSYSCYTLQSAIDRAAESTNASVKLIKDIELAENVTNLKGVKIDENGYEIKAAEGYTLTVSEDGKTYTVAINQYTITFMADGKKIHTSVINHGKAIVPAEHNPAAPQKEGHSFGGYYKEEACINPWVFVGDENRYPGLPIDVVTADTTLYAKFNAKQYTITFDTAGGSAVDAITADYGSAITAPADPTRSGYTFAGWDTEIPATMPAEDMTITAKWDAVIYIPSTPSTPSTPPTTTDKVENEDGSVTTTVTDNKTGTVTETTENVDGSTTVVETQKDGSTTTTNTATSTETGEDGATTETKTETVEKVAADGTTTSTSTTASTTTAADGSTTTETKTEEVVKTENATTATTTTVTETAEKTESVVVKAETIVAEDGTETTSTTTTTEATLANGTTATTVVDNTGSVSAEASVSEQAIAEAAEAEAPVALPVATVSTFDAATITVATGTEEAVTVEIPMSDATTGTVAVLVNADGSETVITETALSENGVTVPVADGATIKLVDNSIDFEDVAQEEWHNDAVDYVSARGIMNGTGDNKFDPKTPTTRAMVWTMLARLDGVDTSSGENWYEAGQKWAMENGISDGTMAMEEVTREQLVTMLWRYIGEPDSDHDLSGYDDHHETSDWAKVAKQWAVENGVIKGVTDTSLDPTGEATRAQVAQMFMNFLGL